MKVGDDYIAFAAGMHYSLALKKDNTMWKWGNDYQGDGINTPRQVGGH